MNNYDVDIKTIYLDMDGVLVDPYQTHAKIVNKPLQDFVTHLNTLQALGKKNEYFFPLILDMILKKGFETVDPMPELDTFKYFITLWQRKGIKVKILTSTMSNNPHRVELERQKKVWLSNWGLSNLEVIMVPGSNYKKTFANKNSLLVDDYTRNIHEWISNGGIGILHTDIQTTTNILKNLGLLND